jgi:glutamine amidotransferase-like uncharacterized protein
MRKQIIIYSDEGVGPASLRYLFYSLQRIPFLKDYHVVRYGHRKLNEGNWQKKTALLVFPGGRDIYYHKALRGAPNRLIREYVESGGQFFGICAGAYYGAEAIVFEEGTELEIKDDRELGFFPGLARGPAYGRGMFRYGTESGARIAQLQWSQKDADHKKNFVSYFNGGCEFVDAEKHPNVTVLARYEDIDKSPTAIVECKVGNGKAILSGVHPEYDPNDFNQRDPYLQAIRKRLIKVDHLRKALFEKLIRRFV